MLFLSNIIPKFDSFRVCVNSERILLKRRQFVLYRTACYSIKQCSTTLVVRRSKNYNSMVSRQNIRFRFLLFFCIFLFCFCETNFDVFYHFSKLSKKCTFHGNICTNGKLKPLSKNIFNY